VLVTGATGFIGGHLIERLSTGDAAIRVTARSPGSCANVARYPVEIAPTDLLDKQQVRAAVAGVRTVYHLAYGREGPEAAMVTIEGTKNVVEAAIEERADCVVVLSTMYVFGFPDSAGPVDESFPYRPYGGEYGRSKAAMERWCLNRARQNSHTRIVVLNPTCVFGPGGAAYTMLPVKLARQGQFCWIEGGRGSCNYTYVTNLVDALLQAAIVPEAAGERFIINDGCTTWRQFLGPLVSPLGDGFPDYTPKELKALPRFGPPFKLRDLISAAATAQEVRRALKRSASVRRLFSGMRDHVLPRVPLWPRRQEVVSAGAADVSAASSLPPDWLALLYGPATSGFSADKARRILNWTPRVAFETAQDETIHWLKDAGYIPDLDHALADAAA